MDADELAERIAANPQAVGLCLDFDGVLAPIVDDPEKSALPEGLPPVLEGLHERLGLVAVVSGRPAWFLAERVAVPGLRLFGLYGLQEWRDGAARPRDDATEWQEAVDHARDRLQAAIQGLEGVALEDKGLAVGLHWRNAPDREYAQRQVNDLVDDVSADTGLAAEPGKFVLELRPPVEWDKGACVRSLLAETPVTLPVYAGDDLGDLPAFEAVQAAGGVAVAVDSGDETPPDFLEAGDVTLPSTEAAGDWLAALRDRLARTA